MTRLARTHLFISLLGAAVCSVNIGCTGGAPKPIFGGGGAITNLNTVPGGPPTPLFASKSASNEKTPHLRPAFKADQVDPSTLPRELNKVTMPPYTVEAPDILLIDAQRLIPLPPYRVEPLDVLYLYAPSTINTTNPLNGPYPVDPDGTINLGADFGGSMRVNELTVQEIEKLLVERLKKAINPKDALAATVSLAQSRGVQQIRGEHLVRPDGTVYLGTYGSVYVAGMTLTQIKQAIEAALSVKIYKPEISVDVSAYNSKFYYVITDFAGNGEQVTRVPATGNETVLDAISIVGGLSAVSSKRVWIARPAPAGSGDQVLPVDWRGVTRRGTTGTNYQVLPGDRVFVMGNPLNKLDSQIGRLTAPLERVFGTTLFGYTTIRTFETGGLGLGFGQ